MKQPTPQAGIETIKPYVAGKSGAQGGKRIVKLSSNENPWGPSQNAIEAFQSTADHLFRYPGSHRALHEVIAKHYPVSADQIICGAGSDELIGLLIQAYAGEGDEVLFSEHAFLMYRLYSLAHGATPVSAPEENLTVNIDALLAKVTAKTKLVFLANPNNPTGTYLPFSEVKRLRDALPDEVILVLDAAYAEYMQAGDYNTGHELVASSNTVVTHTLSKIYGLPALRIGFAHAPAHMIDILNRIRSPFNVNQAALNAAIAAIEDQQYLKGVVVKNAEQLAHVSDAFTNSGFKVVPSHGNFILVDIGSEDEARELNQYFESEGVMVRDVTAYGLAQYLRVSIGTEEENAVLLDALSRFSATKQKRA